MLIFLSLILIAFGFKNLIKDYYENYDCTFFGKKWGKDLVCYLEDNMKDKACDHTFKYTNDFFSKRFFIKRIFKFWIYNHYACDCEVLINTKWRDDLDWRSEPPEFKVNYLDQYLVYKDGTKINLKVYKNGLKYRNILKILNDKHITNLDNEIVKTFPKDTLFMVFPMDYSIGHFGYVNLMSLDGSRHSLYYSDDDKIFDEFQLIDSVEYYKNKIEKNGKETQDSSYYNSLAVAYKNQNDLDNSVLYFKKAVDVAIKTTGIHSGNTFLSKKNLANEYFEQGKYALAIECFQEAIKLNTEDSTYEGYIENFKEKIKIAKRNLKNKNQ